MTIGFIVNHLWQSSCFGLLAGLLAFTLRGNSPKVRYWVWLSASLKFLVPWVLLVSLGSMVPWPIPPAAAHASFTLPDTLIQIATPFSPSPYAAIPVRAEAHWHVTVLILLWAVGFIAITFQRCRNWYTIRAMLRAASPVKLPIAVSAVITPTGNDLGIVGFLRPVLVLPATLLERLNSEQLDALLAHELSHVRRRDNFFAALHMGVEAIFWFHPLVWWIGSRMLEEREMACDEEVLRQGCKPTDYARGILTVCEHCSEALLPGVSGATSADVKKRLKAILRGTLPRELSGRRKAALAFAAVVAIVLPFGLGVWNARAEEAERFEVISIKVHPEPIDFRNEGEVHGMTFHTVGLPLINLMMEAYNMRGLQISGGPSWIRSGAYFDVEAKAGGSAPLTWKRLRPMLQSMLADRFQLQVQHGTREMPCYDLVIAKSGLKLKENTDPGPPGGVMEFADASGGHVRAESGTLAGLAVNISRPAGRITVDKTGLSGKYHITLDYAPIDNPDVTGFPTFFRAMEDQLGLKLEPSHTTLETLVIQSVEKPSAN